MYSNIWYYTNIGMGQKTSHSAKETMPLSRSTRWKKRTEHSNRELFPIFEPTFGKNKGCEPSHSLERHSGTGSGLETFLTFAIIIGVIVSVAWAAAAFKSRAVADNQAPRAQQTASTIAQ